MKKFDLTPFIKMGKASLANKIHEDFMEEDDDEPDYYYCSCCNHVQVKPGMGNGCDNCGLFNVMEEGNY